MKISPTYGLAKSEPRPLTEEQRMQIGEAEAKRKAELEARETETLRANGATVSLSEKSLSALASDDQRIRRNIQWGIVRGMLLYSLFMIPVVLIAALLITAMNTR